MRAATILTVAALVLGGPSVARAAPSVSLKALEPLDLGFQSAEIFEKTAAFGDGRWLAVYANSGTRLAGAWLTSEGEPIGKSFPLFGDAIGERPRLVFDGQNFVLARLGDDHSRVKVTRIGVDTVGPDIDGTPEIDGRLGFHTGPAVTVDAAGMVHVADCITVQGSAGMAYCSISALLADALVVEATFTVPRVVEALEVETAEDGFVLFTEGKRAGVSVVHIDNGGTASDPIVLSATGRSLTAARLGANYAVAWAEYTPTDALHVAKLDALGQVLSTQALPWDINAFVASQLVPTSNGYALAAQGGCFDCAHSVLVQALTPDLQPLSLQPYQLVPCGNRSLFLAGDGDRVLAGWNSSDRYSLQAAVLDMPTLGSESPSIADLSFEVTGQAAVVAAPTADGWLTVWEAELSDHYAIPRLVELRGRRLDPRGVAQSERFTLVDTTGGLSLLDASGGPSGALVTWQVAGNLNATFVPTHSAAPAPQALGAVGTLDSNRSSQVVVAKDGGWLVVHVSATLHSLLADRFGADGSPLSMGEVIATDELIGLLPTDERSGVFGFAVTPNEQGFLLVWGVYAERAYPPNEFDFTSIDFGLYSRQLDADSKPLAADPRSLQAWHTDRPGRERFDHLSVAAASASSWLAWRNQGPGFFSALPLSDTNQPLGAAERYDFLGLRAVEEDVLGVWAAYESAFVALAEPGGELGQQPLLGALPLSLSEPRAITLPDGASVQTLLIGTVVDDHLYGGARKRAGLTLVEVAGLSEATGGGGAGNGSNDAGRGGEAGGGQDGVGAGGTSDAAGAGHEANGGRGGLGAGGTPDAAGAGADGDNESRGCGCRLVVSTPDSRLFPVLLAALALVTRRLRGSTRPPSRPSRPFLDPRFERRMAKLR